MNFGEFNEYTRKIWREDKNKHDVITEIIYSTNYQNEYEGLKNRECYFSYKVIEDRCNISHKKALRIMKELEKEGFIKWVYKSKTKYEKSIILLFKKEPVKEPVKEPSSINISINKSINKSNIYNTIFDFWVAKGVKKHRSLTNNIKKAIDKTLKEYSVAEIEQAINNYSIMYHDKNYEWCSYQWGLDEFLLKTNKDRLRQLPMFLNDGSKWINYQSAKNKGNPSLNNRNQNNNIPIRRKRIQEFKIEDVEVEEKER